MLVSVIDIDATDTLIDPPTIHNIKLTLGIVITTIVHMCTHLHYTYGVFECFAIRKLLRSTI